MAPTAAEVANPRHLAGQKQQPSYRQNTRQPSFRQQRGLKQFLGGAGPASSRSLNGKSPSSRSLNSQASLRLNGLSSHSREHSFRLNGLSSNSKEPSFRLNKGGNNDSISRLPNRKNSRSSGNGSISGSNSRSLLYSSSHTASLGNSTINSGDGASFTDFGASIRICEDSMADMDMSLSMSARSSSGGGSGDRSGDRTMGGSSNGSNNSSSSTRRRKYQRWGDQSVKFSARNFVAQNEESLEAHYLVGGLLGEGGFGEVYSCTHIQSGEERAVKVIPKQEDEAENLRVIEEFDIVKDLDHPNILKMYALFESETQFFLVTDIYAGGELYDELAEFGRFAEKDAALLMNNVLSCINYCHKRGLVHRDLKPENILLEENKDFDDLKVIDFGLAEYGEAFSAMEGSCYYVSPQVIQGQYNVKADVWSIGIIAFVCLAGYAPFEGADDDEVLQSVLDGFIDFEDPAWDDISEEAQNFVAALLTYDEKERPTAEEALQHPWLVNARSRRRQSSCSKRRESTRMSLGCLQSFQANSKLKQCVCSLIASQLLRKDEKEEIDTVFRSMDFDCDGKLTKEDVKQSYKEYFGEDLSNVDIDLMFRQVNFSGSGAIEYSEFVASTLMERNLVDDSKLKAAFNIFDRDSKGFISNQDLKDVLSLDDEMDEYIIHKIIRQVDQNDDGKIQFEEFQDMMYSSSAVPSLKPPSGYNKKAMGSSRTDSTFIGTDCIEESEYSDDEYSENDDQFCFEMNTSQANLSFKSVLDKFHETKNINK